MRAALLALLLLLPTVAAQGQQPAATLQIDIAPDGRETLTLTFDGLRRLTTYERLCLPVGARETRVHDEAGDMPYAGHDEDGRRVLSFTARTERVVVDMGRAGGDASTHPIRTNDVNFCVPSGATTTIRVRAPEGSTLFFLSDGGAVSGRTGSLTHEGAVHAFYAYEAAIAPEDGVVAFEEGPFRVIVPVEREQEAREVARLARAPFAAAATEAGLVLPFDALRVLFTPSTPHDWEAGHYNGRGYVSVKEDTLDPDPQAGYPFSPVKVLVHEAFHALSFPFGKGEVEETIAWWLEGSARLAERHAREAMPNATRHCETQGLEVRCWDFDDRPTRAQVEAGYAEGFTFEQRWEPSLPQDEDTRSFYYGMSALVVGAWIERHGIEAYRDAWDAMLDAFATGEGCPCREGWLLGVLEEAAGARDDDLFAPWGELRASDPGAFAARVAPYVKDEEALQRELDARAKAAIPALLPAPGVGALLAAFALMALARRRA